MRRWIFASVTAMAVAACLGAPAAARQAAAPDRHHHPGGPRLTIARGALAESLKCTADVHHAKRPPVLLVPGTTLDPKVGFSWNYERAFTKRHLPWCAVALPGEAMGDIQVAAEYVVHAIRHIDRIAHRRIDILGYSQGGMVPRWALKYWPDTRREVSDLVAIDPSNHGTVDATGACTPSCAPAIWQQRNTSKFLAALNHGAETWHGISYTVIYSHADEVVVPNATPKGSSSLHSGRGRIRNIAVQDICPADASDHLAMGTYDSVAYALAIDAFTHPGPAKPSRVPRSVCLQPFQPGVDPTMFAANYATYLAHIADVLSTYPHSSAEPPLARYAR